MSNLFMSDSDVVWCRDILIAYSGELLKIIDSLEPLSLSRRWVLNFYVPPVEVLTVFWPKKLVLRDVWLVSNNICINVYRTIWTVRGAPYFIIFSSSSILLKTGKNIRFCSKISTRYQVSAPDSSLRFSSIAVNFSHFVYWYSRRLVVLLCWPICKGSQILVEK